MQNSMREETRKDIVQKKGFKQFQKGRKERPVDTMQQKILRSKSKVEKSVKPKKKPEEPVRGSSVLFYLILSIKL